MKTDLEAIDWAAFEPIPLRIAATYTPEIVEFHLCEQEDPHSSRCASRAGGATPVSATVAAPAMAFGGGIGSCAGAVAHSGHIAAPSPPTALPTHGTLLERIGGGTALRTLVDQTIDRLLLHDRALPFILLSGFHRDAVKEVLWTVLEEVMTTAGPQKKFGGDEYYSDSDCSSSSSTTDGDNSNSDSGVDTPMTMDDPVCLLYTSPSPRDQRGSRMPSSA